MNDMIRLPSFETPMRAVVVGGGGIGAAISDTLKASPNVGEVICLSRRPSADVSMDVTDLTSIALAVEAVKARGPLDLVFVATGVLHDDEVSPEKNLSALDPLAMAHLYQVNTIGPAMVAKHFLPLLVKGRKSAFAALSARVGSIGDNRLGGWHSYRASKAALNMMIRTMSVELRRRNPDALIVALHPGTVDTALSAPFQRGVKEGKLFTADRSARAMLAVLDDLTPEDSGAQFAWDGVRVPE
jgi:NAD(P)-dependent dehydrogenase (short-subunit alcohol dehydrogenase family)